MNEELVNGIVHAVLYEGYILYPYRASAKKNRQRFTSRRKTCSARRRTPHAGTRMLPDSSSPMPPQLDWRRLV